MKNSILLQNVTLEELTELISQGVKCQLQNFRKELITQQANEELLSREQTCKYLQIDSSTLWHWTKKGKVKAYGIAGRRYYKRSELLECLTHLKK